LDRVEELAKEKGVKVPQIAMAYLMNQPLNVFPLIGAKNPDEMRDNIEACEISLTKEELDWLDLIVDAR